MLNLAGKLRALVTPAVAKKPDAFLEMCALFEQRLERWPASKVVQSRGRIGVLVTPWLWTAVPLFTLEIALMLAREGFGVTVFFDTADIAQNAPLASHGAALKRILARLGSAVKIIDVATQPTGNPDHPNAEAILQNNAIWRMRGEAKAGAFLERNPEAPARIAAHLGKVERMLREQPCDWILVPGGIFGLGGIYVGAARSAGVAFSTFDAAPGVLRVACDGIAAHLGDLPLAFATLQNEVDGNRATELAEAELAERAAAKDFRQFQVAPATQRDDLRYDILVPLNIRWDSAALGRQRAFVSVEEWLIALLEWVGEHPPVSICIRQHPRERLDFARGSDDLAPLLSRFAHLGPRLRFVAASEPVNSYDLLRHAKVVLPHTSTFGIEATFLGKPVVLGTDCYYGGFGFVWSADERADYFARVEEAIAGKIEVSAAQRCAAGFAYFLTQRCAFVRSIFNPHAEQFEQWVKMPAAELWALPELADVRTALITRTPLAVVRHRRLVHAD